MEKALTIHVQYEENEFESIEILSCFISVIYFVFILGEAIVFPKID